MKGVKKNLFQKVNHCKRASVTRTLSKIVANRSRGIGFHAPKQHK